MRGELSRPRPDGTAVPRPDPVADAVVRSLLEDADVGIARRILETDDARTLLEQRELTSIPAPPFGEAERAERMAELMRASGLVDVGGDTEGNVVAAYPGGATEGPPLVVTAHLDTVFPAGTDTRVREDGDRLRAPGISDDGRGLAALLAIARALRAGEVPLAHPLRFVATVGEEGVGDLRGVRSLFSEGGTAADGCLGFVSLDGAGSRRIVNAGLGARRYRIAVTGPGGHSWVDWGVPHPIHALGRAVAALVAIPLPTDPASTLSVGRWGGGTSINAIPHEAWVEFEIRSESAETLAEIDARARDAIEHAIGAEAIGHPRELRSKVEVLGDRPAGATPSDATLVRAAAAATRAIGAEPELAVSSTDANIPMSLGIEAITLGAGGEAGQAHTPDEWYRNVRGPEGIQRALLTLLATDRLHANGGG